MPPPKFPKVQDDEDSRGPLAPLALVLIMVSALGLGYYKSIKDDIPSDYDKCVEGDSVMIYESDGGKTCIKLEDLRRLYGRP